MEKMMEHSFGGDDNKVQFDGDAKPNLDQDTDSKINPRQRMMSESFIKSPPDKGQRDALEIKLIKTNAQNDSDEF